ncbi:MAG: xanthine dehydrogenase family protein subunit M [Chloroflexi bacterium]|nr:xanthine dehydrogenase family protein subunit M [Chloroflexota bacterium]
MQEFEYVAPANLEDAIRLMAEKGPRAKALAGGTDILIQLRGGRFQIDRLVDIKKIPELNELSFSEANGLTVGAAVECYRVYEDQTVQKLYPGLFDSASLIGGIQIQGRATVGGNLCNAAPSGDNIPSLIVQEAVAIVAGPNGRRNISVEDFCAGPGRNVLQEGELLVAIHIPTPKPNFGAHFLRFIPRNEMDIAIANSAVSVLLDDSKQHIVSARIAIGSVAPTPVFAREASALLTGKEANEASIEEAAEATKAAASPINDMRGTIDQRIHLVGVLTKRALRTAISRAREG